MLILKGFAKNLKIFEKNLGNLLTIKYQYAIVKVSSERGMGLKAS